MICVICGKQNAQYKTITETFEYKNHKLTIDDYEVIYCPDCEETLVTVETMDDTKQTLRDFKNVIDEKLDVLLWVDKVKKREQ